MSKEDQGEAENMYALIGLICCTLAFGYYLKVQMSDSGNNEVGQQKVDEKRVEAIKNGDISLRGAMMGLIDESMETSDRDDGLSASLLNDEESLLRKKLSQVLIKFYAQYDADKDNRLDVEELRLIMNDLKETFTSDELHETFNRFDVDGTGYIEFSEFVTLIMDYLIRTSKQEYRGRTRNPAIILYADDGDDEEGEDEEEIPEDLADLSPEEQQARIKQRAFTTMGLGTLLVTLFSDPMTDCLAEWGNRIGVSPFYIAFIVAPLASNSAELIAAYNYSLKKTSKSMTISLCALEGAAVMNNTFCLGTFYFVIWLNHLPWTFTAETISILAVQFAVGFSAMRRVQPYRNGVYVLMLYPLSLILVYVLENVYGIK
jgi:Ca2+/Na+ antiporter